MTTADVSVKHRRRDVVLCAVSLLLLAALMALKGHHRGGVLVGFVLTLVATVGALGLLGDSPLDLRGDEVPRSGDPRPWWQREGALVLIVSAVLYLPLAGAFGLWDPWETHYAEVGREILARDDWITLWWAQEGWFMSKPILIFWLCALGLGTGSLLGVGYQADTGPGFQEWFIRLPVCALSIAALYALYRAVARAWGPRAGLLAAAVLGTMPHWFFLTHQAMTDMPFVAPLVIAMAMLMLALTDDPEDTVRARAITLRSVTLRVSLWHLSVGLILMLALPQILYLLTRPVMFSCPDDALLVQCQRTLDGNRLLGVQMPVEFYYSGSGGNSATSEAQSIPGSPRWERLASTVPFFPSVLQGLLWVGVLVWVLDVLRRERRTQGLHFVLFYVWCAVSTMGKGPAGLAIPGAVAFLFFLSTGRWRDLLRIRLGIGVLAFLLVGMPWYVAITSRLGEEFLQRFVVHDLINRATLGVHGDTGTVRYFLWQLGYAMFPWSGLVAVALVAWRVIAPRDATDAQRTVARLAALWFLLGFVLFSAMVTKFHHYIFPAIPGAAVMVALLIDRLLGRAPTVAFSERVRPMLAQASGLLLVVLGAARLVGSMSGAVPRDGVQRANVPMGVALLTAGVVVWIVGLRMHDGPRSTTSSTADDDTRADRLVSTGIGALALGAAVLVAFVARDLATTRGTPPGSERLIHLFVYNYERPWPTRFLDFRGALFGFGVMTAASVAGLAIARARAYAAQGIVVASLLFAAWGLNVYMIDITPHWSQRDLFARYYAMRRPQTRDPRFTHDPIVAHQMNWKGENFYTGNRVVAEECGLKYCTGSTTEFVRDHAGSRVFFVTEHTRLSGLLTIIRNAGGDGRAVTTEAENNKFVLVEATLGNGAANTQGSSTRAGDARWTPTETR